MVFSSTAALQSVAENKIGHGAANFLSMPLVSMVRSPVTSSIWTPSRSLKPSTVALATHMSMFAMVSVMNWQIFVPFFFTSSHKSSVIVLPGGLHASNAWHVPSIAASFENAQNSVAAQAA